MQEEISLFSIKLRNMSSLLNGHKDTIIREKIMYTVIIYSKLTNEILFEKEFSDYYRAYSYAQKHIAKNSYYEIVETY